MSEQGGNSPTVIVIAADSAAEGAAPDPSLEGTYANVVSRFVAFVLDLIVIAAVFAVGSAVVERMLELFTDRTIHLSDSEPVYRIFLGAWAFLYCAYPLAVAGRTLGMAVLGLRALKADGSTLSGTRAVIRVLVFPLSFALLGLGFLLIVLRRDHRALHDLIAGSAVVYSWHARAAHLSFLVRQ
jgi:uncharacterized RDD family membrane protein YckC